MVVIATSASIFEKDRQRSLAAGADAFLPKPFDPPQLFGQLAEHLSLEWIHKKVAGKTAGSAPSPRPMVPPSRDELAALVQSAVEGDLGAIRLRARKLERSDHRLKPFAEELRALARGFQMKKIREFLKSFEGI